MKKLYFTIITLVGLIASVSAQYVDNALLFSEQNYGSTARSKAMGNAFGALGGDFGSLSINPAGIGIYLRGETSVTLSNNRNNTESTYLGTTYQNGNNSFNFKNLGYVSVLQAPENTSGIISYNFGVGFNRLANFNQDSYVKAENVSYSRMDAFAQNTNGINFNNLVTSDAYDPYASGIPWESKMAWENYLIDVTNPTTSANQYNTFLLNNETVKQTESATREGFINEYVATFGANFNHKLYLGATVGMQDLFLDEVKVYSESGENNANTQAGSWGRFDYTNNARTSGVGYNLKLGAIFRATPVLRIGLALHTPTFFNIKETYSSVMTSNLTGISSDADGSHSEMTPIGNFEYRFHTPLRGIGSIAYQFAKRGLVSLDYEYVDYSMMNFSHGMGSENFSAENSSIKSIYQAVSNIRVGAEYRVTDSFCLRGGMELLGNPYKSTSFGLSQPNADYQYKTYNGGFGYRSGNYSIDMTYSLGDKTNFMYLYQVDGATVDPVKYHSLRSEILLTIALKM
jgi:long-subunit fatty acid transport protein